MKNSLHQNFLRVMIILSFCTHTYAIETDYDCRANVLFAEVSYFNAGSDCLLQNGEFLQTSYPALSEIGQSLLQPPDFFNEQNSRPYDKINKLPPVPSTIYLVLLGFSFILMVRHRQAWILAFSGMIFIGKTCACCSPRFLDWGRRQVEDNKQSLKNCVADARRTDLSLFGFDEYETREYLGLLRRLAGYSDGDSSFMIEGGGLKRRGIGADNLPLVSSFGSDRGTISSPPALEAAKYCVKPSSLNLKGWINSLKVFSSPPIFSILPRGPPR